MCVVLYGKVGGGEGGILANIFLKYPLSLLNASPKDLKLKFIIDFHAPYLCAEIFATRKRA
jgi:hypothetical protein